VTRRVSAVLRTLPKDITPVNLEELRRVKQVLVELESKADTLRCGAVPALQVLGVPSLPMVSCGMPNYVRRKRHRSVVRKLHRGPCVPRSSLATESKSAAWVLGL